MGELYQLLLILLSKNPEIKWIDLNVGQLKEEKPPVIFPCALIDINIPKLEDIQKGIQKASGGFTITLAYKSYAETNSKTEKPTRTEALDFFRISENCYKILQGFHNENFFAFSNTSQRLQTPRKGLKVLQQEYETSWHVYIANS